TIHGATQPTIHGATQPTIHGATQPTIHGATQPTIHGATQPAMHGATQPTSNNSATQPILTNPATQPASTNFDTGTNRKPLGRLIGAFKTVSTKDINQIRNTPSIPVWQRNYYEHIIRDKEALHNIRHYIQTNPSSWDADQLHPNNPSKW
ncbi:MAG: hypothetical protein WCD18_16205, partial [Thermosynechococcaceae cyanobacterium]